MKKAKQPILYMLSSGGSWVIDEGLFYVVVRLFGTVLGGYATTVAAVAGRVVSSFVNFNFNRLIFGGKGSYGKAMLRYYCIAVPTLLISTVVLNILVRQLHIGSAEGEALIKIAVDAALFVANFFLQKMWVFSNKNKAES